MRSGKLGFGFGVLAGMAALVACGGGGGTTDAGVDLGKSDHGVDLADPGTQPTDPGSEAREGVEIVDPGVGEDLGELPDGIAELPDGVVDDRGVDAPDAGPECPGGFLCPCTSNGQCYSNFCVETADGGACSKSCSGEGSCPQGWSCSQVSLGGPDLTYVCVDLQTRLCRPCKADADCAPAIGAGSQRFACLSHGDTGSFCGTPCQGVGDCPANYSCEATGEGRAAVKQCVPSDGNCPCTAAFQQMGYRTVCTTRNSFGACLGERTCDKDCDAKVPAAEECNGKDDDCNGEVDDGLDGLPCDIKNESGTCPGLTQCAAGKSSCQGTAPAPEACNGKDDNCNGATDEEGAVGCTKYYRDDDGDKYGTDADAKCLCAPTFPYVTQQGGDCSDADAEVHPGVNEVCNGKDDNCNGQVDEAGALNCSPYYLDEDLDGYGIEANSKCLCAGTAPYTARKIGDCDDTDPAVRPSALESCNTIDDNCNGAIDEDGASGCQNVYLDNDRDGYGVNGSLACKCVPAAPYDTAMGGDCDDANVAVHPGVTEACNGRDDDCNGQTDEAGASGCTTFWLDLDGDTFGQEGQTRCLCAPDTNAKYTATRAGDCNDSDGTVFPGQPELCNFKDDNCNGVVDDAGATGCTTYFVDVDKDGWGVFGTGLCLCRPDEATSRTSTREGDCQDNDKLLNPDIPEKCDGVDNDCDGAIDEENAQGCAVYFRDKDRDGFGVQAEAKCLCAKAGEYTTQTYGDCCDTDDRAYPGQGAWFSGQNACNSWDYNCSDATDYEWGASGGGCDGWAVGSGCGLTQGWVGSRAACGESKEWVSGGCGYCCIAWVCCCDPSKVVRTQRCH